MTDQERLDFDRLNTFVDEGRLIRGRWMPSMNEPARTTEPRP